jgi:hypothetical protein
MARIPESYVSVFKEAANTVLDNFTRGELADFEVAAIKLTEILERAKKRQQERLKTA